MKQKLLLFAFTLLSTMLFSQAVPTAFEEWNTTAGTQNFYYKPVVKVDGTDTYIAGATMNASGNLDILVAKYNSGGHQVWIQQYAGSANSMDFAADMAISSTYIYITGAVTTNTTTLLTDAVTMKFNKSNGAIQWTSTYNGVAGGADAGKSIVLDATTSSVLITGASYNSTPNTDILTIRYDATTGGQQWAKIYNGPPNKDDAGIAIRSNGTIVNVGGASQQSTSTQYRGAYLTYAISNGSLTATSLGAVTSSSVESIQDFAIDASGNIFIAGYYNVSGQGYNFYVQKILASTSNVTVAWTYTYNANNLDDIPQAMQLDASGNVYIAGYSTHSTQGRNTVVMKLNSSGVNQWIQTSSLSGDDEIKDMVLDASNNIYVTGYKTNSSTQKDYYTLKYNNSGTKQWEIERDSRHQNDYATNVALDTLGNIIVLGQTELTHNVFEYTTVKYIQKDVLPFSDYASEAINSKSLYIPNKGQLLNTSLSNVTDILFYNLNSAPETYIARNRMSLLQFHRDTLASTTDSLERIDLVFRNCKMGDKVYSEDNGTSYDYNFFVGSTKANNIHAYNKIIAPEIYTGIDLHYYSNSAGVKAYFVIKPGADPKQISILLQGHQTATITSNNLQINGLLGTIKLRKPNVYNSLSGVNTLATGTTGWAISGNTVSINTGVYNTSQPLIIEFSHTYDRVYAGLSSAGPSDNLDWCTYYGNTSNDGFRRIAIDKSNNKYAGGTSDGNNYPTTTGVYSGTNVGGTAVVITKFNYLNKCLHSTYYNGTSSASGFVYSELKGIAVDSLQNIFFTGRTSCSNFPFPSSQPAGSYHYTTNLVNNGNYEMAYVIKLDSAMQNNLWGTHIGNSSMSNLEDVMVDKNQNVTVAGWCTSAGTTFNFPTPPSGAYYNTQGTGLLFRFNNNGVAQYATRTSNWIQRVVENKANGDYFIASWLYTGDPGQKFKNPGGGAYYDSLVYLHDFYLARFNNQDSITWATVFGGTHEEYVVDMAIKDSTLILAGHVDAEGFPIRYAPGQYVDSIHSITGATDYDVAFVRFNAYTGKWIYSSLYGGEFTWASGGILRNDKPTSITIDDNGNYFISGNSSSDPASGFHLMQSSGFYYSGTYYGNNSGFLLSYKSNNDLRHASYFGGRPWQGTSLGSDDTYMYDMGISNGALFVAGQTNANRYFPIYDASGGVAYFDSVLTSPIATQAYTDGFMASFTNLAFVGVHDIDKNEVFGDVLVYPNPSNGIYTIEMKGVLTNKNIIFNVYNVMGQIVYKDETKVHDNFISKQINLSNLTQGVYFINIIQDNKSLTAKVIKQ